MRRFFKAGREIHIPMIESIQRIDIVSNMIGTFECLKFK